MKRNIPSPKPMTGKLNLAEDPFYPFVKPLPNLLEMDRNKNPCKRNIHIEAFIYKASSFFSFIHRFRAAESQPQALSLRVQPETSFAAFENKMDLLLMERRRKFPVFGRPPTWTFLIPNAALLLFFYFNIYEPG
eukprot:TRINITY_DN3163_c1_g2_i1.p1 TRINITY_DN3163_c1_g2~~TRINITY_DN3163_c1_g2_i1.p1  ORF type:complete len:134 (+),score=5.77 TRINITY_DN3163_c1_g2_i1:147-548(+)